MMYNLCLELIVGKDILRKISFSAISFRRKKDEANKQSLDKQIDQSLMRQKY